MVSGASLLALRLMTSSPEGAPPPPLEAPVQAPSGVAQPPTELANSLNSVIRHVEKTEKRHRIVRGSLRLTFGVAAFSGWLAMTLTADNRSDRQIASAMLTATSPVLIPGIVDVSFKGKTEKVLKAPVIRTAMKNGWTDTDVVAVRGFLRRESRRARRGRIVSGTAEALLGVAGVVIYAIAIPDNFSDQSQTATGVAAYGTMLGGSSALIARGIANIVRPSGLEQLAASF